MALPTVLTGGTYCQEEKAKGKHVSPFLHLGLQLCRHPVPSQCYGFAAGPLPFLCCVLSMKASHLHLLLWPVLVDLSFLVRGHEAVCPSKSRGTADVPGRGVPGSHSGVTQRQGTDACSGQCLGCRGLLQVFAQHKTCFQVGFPKESAFHHFLSQLSFVVI